MRTLRTYLAGIGSGGAMLGAAVAALTAGIIRETFGSYTYAWFGGAALCLIAAALSIALRRPRDVAPTSAGGSEHQGNADREMEAEVASDLTP